VALAVVGHLCWNSQQLVSASRRAHTQAELAHVLTLHTAGTAGQGIKAPVSVFDLLQHDRAQQPH
jgi:hypothetical protein